MAQITIPSLQEITTIDLNSIFVVDSGIQTYKIAADDLAQGLRPLMTPSVITSKTSNYSLSSSQESGVIPINSSGGSFNIQLPNPTTMAGKRFTIKDIGGALLSNPVTIVRYASETIEGASASYVLRINNHSWDIFCDGTNWTIIDGMIPSLGQQLSSSSGNAYYTDTSFTDIPNLTRTLTTKGRPVLIFLQPDETANDSTIYIDKSGVGASGSVALLRDGSIIARWAINLAFSGISPGYSLITWMNNCMFLDTAADAGAHTYKYQLKMASGVGMRVSYQKVVCFEMP